MTLTPTTRASLLFRLRDSQDHEAWVEFVSLYEPVAYRLLRRHGLQDADAREVMQDLLMAVSRNIDRWDPAKERGSFRGWLRRVARNLVINWLKQRERRVIAAGGSDLQAMLDMLPAVSGPEPADSGPETVEFEHELRRALFQRAAEQVREEVHPATWQAFWETGVVGTSPADAAKKLGMEVGAIRVAKCRVVARLRAAVNEMEKSA
jgi:RNA polymerase sigma factor (sigma-70 family)